VTDVANTAPCGWPAHVVLVTAPDCHFCAEAKATLGRLSHEFPIEVHEVAFTSPRGQALVAEHGIMFPPGLLLDESFVGFGRVSERKLWRLLERRTKSVPIPHVIGG
jgi:glutaredoxin